MTVDISSARRTAMQIKTSGTAIIRHKDTGHVFEIEADKISDLWDSVGADEEPMGTRTTWEASIELPELGTLTWRLWEYPEGTFNGTDTDIDGHELVSDFQITLACPYQVVRFQS